MNFFRRNALPLLVSALLVCTSCYSQQGQPSTLPAPEAAAPSLPAAPVPAPASPPLPAPAPAAAPGQPPPPPPGANAAAANASAADALTVDQAIARAEAEYAHGQANYAAGHLEAAKDNFDDAFNLLLRTPTGIQNDERLQAEFDKIVEATHDLEMQALKAGDGFTEQHAEPAPIDEANNITFPADPTIKAKAQAELASTHSDLPLMLTDPVVSYINYFSSRGHEVLERALVRRGRYGDMISRILLQEGVPQDLVFLAEAESGFQPHALSRVGALGMWQFMPWDGTHAGLERNWWVDERQDPEKATRAAARLLRDLFNQFGDWYLAMAAYNSGPGTVQRAVERTGYADFWELYRRNVLPQETRNYVPIIVAMTIMAKNPSQYGLEHLPVDPPIASDTVRIHYPIDLRLVAECTDSSTQVLQDLNPSLLRLTTPKDTDFDLHLPPGSAAKFQEAVAAIPEEKRVYWRYHRVEAGETLSEVARRYHTTPSVIAEANNLQGDALAENAKLIIPVSPARSGSGSGDEGPRSASVRSSKRPTRYIVRRGDTIYSLSDEFGVPVEKIRQWNRLKGNQLPAGRSLTIFPQEAGAGADPPDPPASHRRGRSAPQRASEQRASSHHAGSSASHGRPHATSRPTQHGPSHETQHGPSHETQRENQHQNQHQKKRSGRRSQARRS